MAETLNPQTQVEVTQADLDAVKPILEELDVSWWLTDKYHQALAQAYALGKQAHDRKDSNG